MKQDYLFNVFINAQRDMLVAAKMTAGGAGSTSRIFGLNDDKMTSQKQNIFGDDSDDTKNQKIGEARACALYNGDPDVNGAPPTATWRIEKIFPNAKEPKGLRFLSIGFAQGMTYEFAPGKNGLHRDGLERIVERLENGLKKSYCHDDVMKVLKSAVTDATGLMTPSRGTPRGLSRTPNGP